MQNQEKAKIILEHLDKYIQIDWNQSSLYIKGIMEGLKEIERSNKT